MRLVKFLAGLAIVVGTFAIAAPAGAHTFRLSGVASCSDGSHLVTWSITDDLAHKAMSITATSIAEGVSYDVSVVTNPVPGGGTTQATTLVPGGVTGTITITVVATWPDEFTRTETATVGLPDMCTPTETTAPATTAPPTTTPPTTARTQGSVGGVSSAPTTGVLAANGLECGSTTLPCTGSSGTGRDVALGLGLVLAGAGLIALRRRPVQSH